MTGSQQVSWWSVHEYVESKLAATAPWPMAGTPAWRALPDEDPRKLAAVLDAAQHHALRVETAQQQRAEASCDISAAADWSVIAQHVRDRGEFYAQRPWLKRRAS